MFDSESYPGFLKSYLHLIIHVAASQLFGCKRGGNGLINTVLLFYLSFLPRATGVHDTNIVCFSEAGSGKLPGADSRRRASQSRPW